MTVLGLTHCGPVVVTPAMPSHAPRTPPAFPDVDALTEFDSELRDTEPVAGAPVHPIDGVTAVPGAPRTPHPWWTVYAVVAGVALAAAALTQATTVAIDVLRIDTPARSGPGLVYVDSQPSGVEVWVNGTRAGLTPMRFSFAEGAGVVELRHDGVVRALPITIAPGEVLRQRVEFVGMPPADLSPVLSEPAPAAASLEPSVPDTVSPSAELVDMLPAPPTALP